MKEPGAPKIVSVANAIDRWKGPKLGNCAGPERSPFHSDNMLEQNITGPRLESSSHAEN